MKILNKLLIIFLVLIYQELLTTKAQASPLLTISDTTTTSRPSSASPLNSDASIGDDVLKIYDNNSRFLSSDNVKIIRTSNAANIATGFMIASQASELTSVYLTNEGVSDFVQAGTDVLINSVTAMHKIVFKTVNPIPAGGKIIITFPGISNNTASPSASSFAFNGLNSDTGEKIKAHNAICSITVESPRITCVTSNIIVAGTTITLLIGCANNTETSCITQSPTIINPTKKNIAGESKSWLISITTQDSSTIPIVIDSGKAVVSNIESVTIRANVDPTITFTITGINNGSSINYLNPNCGIKETTNTGINATFSSIDIGVVDEMPEINQKLNNITAQRINITTNISNGYSLTATSSSHLINTVTDTWFNDWITPRAFNPNVEGFGLHPCGTDAPINFNEGLSHSVECFTKTSGSSSRECLYSWPTSTKSITIASRTIGPVQGENGSGITSISYAAGTDKSILAGTYKTSITYLAIPIF